MTRYVLDKSFAAQSAPPSPAVTAVADMFGLGPRFRRRVCVLDELEVNIAPGQVVYITGGSGAGKSVALRALAEKMQVVARLEDQLWPEHLAVIDCFNAPLDRALYWLSMAGLSDAFAVLRWPAELSAGQLYRFRLALALAQRPSVICIDEFCNALDRITAAVVAHNVRKCADKFKTTFLLATSHDDLLEDLQPDVVVVKYLGSQADVFYPPRPCTELSGSPPER